MSRFDDLAEMRDAPQFHICQGCGKARVFKPGDFCRECAIYVNDTYIIVEPMTMASTIQRTGLAGEFLESKYKFTEENGCAYIVFFARGELQDVVIDKRFHIPTAMKQLFERLHD